MWRRLDLVTHHHTPHKHDTIHTLPQEQLQDGAAEAARLQEAKGRLQQRTVELAAELADEKVGGCVYLCRCGEK